MDNRFNLVDEPWIPVSDAGRVSLGQLFTNPTYRSLGGNAIQKMAVLKLLLAIAQAAVQPHDETEWHQLGPDGLARCCLDYLQRWHHRFFLFGETPFLQVPAISAARVQPFGAALAEVSTGNTTVLSQIQMEKPLDHADQALVLVSLMAFALAGKKTDNSVVLTPGYQGKTNAKGKAASSKPGPAMAHMGLLHNTLMGENLWQTLHLNLLTIKQIQQLGTFPGGVGTPPWECMPAGEGDEIANALKSSLIGRLVPLCRFCLLTENGLHYSEGLAHPGYKEGGRDPTIAVNDSGKEPKAVWVDPERRPWRELPALLSFLSQEQTQGAQCIQLASATPRARQHYPKFAVWSGGLRVSSNAGEQFISGSDDFVESLVWLDSEQLGALWFIALKQEMVGLDELAKTLYGRVVAYFKDQKVDGAKLAAQATQLFWQLCERDFQSLVFGCDQVALRQPLRRRFAEYVHQAYDRCCPNSTARQLDAWARCRPNLSKYLAQEA